MLYILLISFLFNIYCLYFYAFIVYFTLYLLLFLGLGIKWVYLAMYYVHLCKIPNYEDLVKYYNIMYIVFLFISYL